MTNILESSKLVNMILILGILIVISLIITEILDKIFSKKRIKKDKLLKSLKLLFEVSIIFFILYYVTDKLLSIVELSFKNYDESVIILCSLTFTLYIIENSFLKHSFKSLKNDIKQNYEEFEHAYSNLSKNSFIDPRNDLTLDYYNAFNDHKKQKKFDRDIDKSFPNKANMLTIENNQKKKLISSNLYRARPEDDTNYEIVDRNLKDVENEQNGLIKKISSLVQGSS